MKNIIDMKSIVIIVFGIIIFMIVLIYYSCYINMYRYYSCSSINHNNLFYLDRRYLKLPKVKSTRKVIISLTTIPQRINKLRGTLASLLSQSHRVDEIYINIPPISLKGVKYVIPKWLSKLNNVKINLCDKDYGPATKLLPSLIKEDKKTIIIIVDDDIIYGFKMVETHVRQFYQRNCKDALTIFGWMVDKNSNSLRKFSKFKQYLHVSKVDLLGGYSSFVVTPKMFPPDIFDYEQAPKECIWVDDIWISGWLAVNNVNIYCLGYSYNNIPISNVNNSDSSMALSSTKNLSSNNENITVKWFQTNKNIWN
jgi:hypothetical protein